MLQQNITTFFENNEINKSAIAVAVSGGADSLALTLLLDEFCKARKIKLFAITIDHGLRKSSSVEALHLGKILAKHKINHEIIVLSFAQNLQSNIEAKLREARYEQLYSFCIANKIEHLFLGHHLGDVAENFLIRLFRGSQIDGLSVMQEILQFKKIKLCRPFLNVTKEDLKKYLAAKKIKWFEDESNDDEKFLRNKIRKFFDVFEEKNLIQMRIKNAAEKIQEIKELSEDILLDRAASCLVFDDNGSFKINLKEYQKIPPIIALKILSLVLIEVSGEIYKPRLKNLQNFEEAILKLPKGKKKNFYGCMAKSLGNQVIEIYRDENAIKHKTVQFDEKTTIIDGRFLAKLKNGKASKPYKFYFRTILEKLSSSENSAISN